jgi:hypothetical protein
LSGPRSVPFRRGGIARLLGAPVETRQATNPWQRSQPNRTWLDNETLENRAQGMKSKLRELADACNHGACNPHGIINSLPGKP